MSIVESFKILRIFNTFPPSKSLLKVDAVILRRICFSDFNIKHTHSAILPEPMNKKVVPILHPLSHKILLVLLLSF